MAFDYTKYNYDELVDEVTRLIASKEEWKDNFQSSMGQTLTQLIAAVVSQLHYMLERRSEENYMSTAKLPTSVKSIAGSLGYRPKRAVSSSGELQLTITDENGSPTNPELGGVIDFPKYTPVTFEDVQFLTTRDVTIVYNTPMPVVVPVSEGIVEVLTFDSTQQNSTLSAENYILLTDYEDIEEDSFVITTPTQTFSDVIKPIGNSAAIGALAFATPEDVVFDLRVSHDGLRIMFGDGKIRTKARGHCNRTVCKILCQ